MPVTSTLRLTFAGLLLAATLAPAAHAQLALSQLVVDLQQQSQDRADIDISNNGHDRLYVAVEPREILGAGTAHETATTSPDPENLGLLVSPERLILEPGQHRLLRIASIAPPGDRERVYRVTVKPVIGAIVPDSSGLKILVGYDLLVLVRPPTVEPRVTGTRSGDTLTLHNAGNVSVQLVDGKQCAASVGKCDALPDARLYVGEDKTVRVAPNVPASYRLEVRGKVVPVQF